ncbi:MAG: hypothetical protein ACLGP3_05205 [Acidobacteriota bacterium]
MNSTPGDARGSGAGTPAASRTYHADYIDDTLRLLATAPVPAGLEERIHAALEEAPRQARVLRWPAAAWPSSMRAAAAAAIVAVVTGGGWSVYTRVQHLARTAAPAGPRIVLSSGGFSSAGAMRTPQTVQGPAVHPEELGLEKKGPEVKQPEVKRQEKKAAPPAGTPSPTPPLTR